MVDTVPGFIIGGWSRGQPLPGRYPNFRLAEGKRMFHKTIQFRRSEPLLTVPRMAAARPLGAGQGLALGVSL